jgi:hypothetical protein
MTLHPSPSRRHTLILGLGLGLGLSLGLTPHGSAAADSTVSVGGLLFERRAQVAGAELLLNGTGLRAVAWFKAYAAALYLGGRASTAAEAVNLRGPKRLQLRMARDLPAAEFVKALNVGLPRNSDAALGPQLAGRQAQLAARIAALDTLHANDTIDLDFDPDQGLLFRLNGKVLGEPIAGEDFYGALLRVFIGDHPSDAKLKAGLLGNPS